MIPSKVIVTHLGALEAKYRTGVSRVLRAVHDLVAADARRGIGTILVGLDRAPDLAPFGASPVRGAGDEEGAKRAFDAIDEAIRPHYYLILGGPDIVPMQQLENPAGLLSHAAGTGDSDLNLPSDMPYACDAPWSRDPADFLYPSRVVGRLPDLLWARSPTYVVDLLRLAAAARPLPKSAYKDWFALSAGSWEVSTELTAKALFGGRSRLHLSPPRVDPWPASVLAPRVHFINCHGGNMADAFNGEYPASDPVRGGEQTVAITARTLRDRVTPGTVVAAECCYGAQLFDSGREKLPSRGSVGIALEYLRQGACGFFGSSTVAYGPEDRNEHADVICRVFVEKVLAGSSIGRAALEARIAYARSVKWVSPVMWKTLAQFHLLGDPSLHPVEGAPPERHRAQSAAAAIAQERERRRRRRERSRREARVFAQARQVLQEDDVVLPERKEEFLACAEQLGVRNKAVRALTLVTGLVKVSKGDPSLAAWRQANQVLMIVEAHEEARKALRGRQPYPRVTLAIAHYRGGAIAHVERLVSR